MPDADALARCQAEQAECAEYIRAGGPEQRGAWLWMTDQIMEECLILLEQEAAP